MSTLIYRNAEFMLSVAHLSQLPEDAGIEVAIVGRSNAGKSSVLNQLTQQKALARVSKTPGRTQLLNFFKLDKKRRLVDLPGYGYAKVPPALKQEWQLLMNDYFHTRQSLKGLIVVMDIRHPLKEFDQIMLSICADFNLPAHILLNKADKLTNNAIQKTLTQTAKALSHHPHEITLQAFSATNGLGLKSLHDKLAHWFEF